MIQLKMKMNTSTNMKTQSDSDPFESQMKPYTEKVISCLGQTDLDKELVFPLERAIKNKTVRDVEKLFQEKNFNIFKDIYMNNARHIIENLKMSNQINNVELIDKVNFKQITIEQLVELSPEEMHKSRWQQLLEKKELDVKKLVTDPEATSELFWCSRCHRNKTRYFQRQDRSADEPMTIHITCCYCGCKWRC